jgi:hypothetical protein
MEPMKISVGNIWFYRTQYYENHEDLFPNYGVLQITGLWDPRRTIRPCRT